MSKPAIKIALQYGLGLGILALVVWWNWNIVSREGEQVGVSAVLERSVNWSAFAAAFIIYCVCVLITFYRWYLLVRAQDLPFTFSQALRLGLIGFYLSTFLPGSVGGDIIKAVGIAREQSRRTVAVATVVLDRIIGLCGLFWLVTLLGNVFAFTGTLETLAVSPQALSVLRGILLLATCLSFGSLAFWFAMGFFSDAWLARMAERIRCIPKLGGPLAELWRTVWLYRRRSGSVALALGISLVTHFGFVMTYYFGIRALIPAEQIPSLEMCFLIIPVGMTIQAGVPTPGGVGGGEAGFGGLFNLVGYSIAVGVLGSLAVRAVNWVLGLIGYLVYLRMKSTIVVSTGNESRDDVSAPRTSEANLASASASIT